MRDKRHIYVLACAVFCGLIAAILVGRYLSGVAGRSNNIVSAKVDIPLGTKITAEQLTIQQLPSAAVPEGTFTEIEKVVGRVTVINVGTREPLTELKLAPEGSEAGLTAMIAEGCRAMTVKVDDVVGVSGFAQPGAYVDVVAVVDRNETLHDQGPASKIVLQHIKVLASDRNIDKKEKEGGLLSAKAVTLQVTPEQAEKLALASAEGKLQLVMRNTVDKGDVHTPGANKDSLLGGMRVVPEPTPVVAKNSTPEPTPAAAKPAKRASSLRRRLPSSLTLVSMESKSANTEKSDPPPSRVSVEVLDGGKRHTVVVP